MTKNRKLIILLVVLMISIILFMVIKGILAFNYDRQATSNVFTIGNVKIKITEGAEWDAANANNTVPSFAQNKAPGSTIPKAPQVQNTGVNPAYVYMKVYVPIYDSEELFSYTLNTNSGWTERTEVFHTNDGKYNVYVYEYDTALAPNATTPALFNSVTLANITAKDVKNMGTTNTKVIIKGFAIQSENGIIKSSNEMTTKMLNTTANSETVGLILPIRVKYAVQIYGIRQDVDANGNTLGLTFGPAIGENYNNKYVTHTYEETSSGSGVYNIRIQTYDVDSSGNATINTTLSGLLTNSEGNNVTRTVEQYNARKNIKLHDMTWAQIKNQSATDPTVFEDCMLCGDTKSVSLKLNSTIGSESNYNQYGDGAGALYNTINTYYTRWNPNQSQNSYVGTGVTLDSNEIDNGSNARNAGGYSVSHIRATLIGENTKTNKGYAGDVNLTEDTCLYSCIEEDLQAVITPKKIKYVTGTGASSYTLNDDIADSIWLFSDREMYGTGQYSGYTTEGIGSSGDGYARFSNPESKYYSRLYMDNNANRVVYYEAGSRIDCWLRSPYLSNVSCSRSININGNIVRYDSACNGHGLGFGFCIQ